MELIKGIKNAAVLPVPFFALAITECPSYMIGITSSWMGEGNENPLATMPIIVSFYKLKSCHYIPLVYVTSSVKCGFLIPVDIIS